MNPKNAWALGEPLSPSRLLPLSVIVPGPPVSDFAAARPAIASDDAVFQRQTKGPSATAGTEVEYPTAPACSGIVCDGAVDHRRRSAPDCALTLAMPPSRPVFFVMVLLVIVNVPPVLTMPPVAPAPARSFLRRCSRSASAYRRN